MSIASRDKMISFRLSTKEYQQLRKFCIDQEVRSVSELARVAVNRLICDPAPASEVALEARFNELEGQLHRLALELKKLKQAEVI